MMIGTALSWDKVPTIVLSVLLAFLFGYALTMRSLSKSGVPFKQALKVALAADSFSIALMELVDNSVMAVIPGAMDAGLLNALFWGSLAFSLGLAFLAAWPLNHWLIERGMGHAKVHRFHQHHHEHHSHHENHH